MSHVLLPIPRRPRHRPSRRWLQWQGSTVSQRLLSEQDRQYGYTVLWVPPSLREPFMDVAEVLRLYDALIQKPQRVETSPQLASLRAWGEATQALIAALQEDAHD